MRTITLKLHNPSKRKCSIIDEAMTGYNNAYQYLLDKAGEDVDNIRRNFRDPNGRFRGSRLEKWIGRELSKQLNSFGIEPFKDSIKMDFGMTLAGFLNLSETNEKASYPLVYVPGKQYEKFHEDLFKGLVSGTVSHGEYMRESRRIADKNCSLKPLFFCRYDVNRDYCLLYDRENNRYYAKLYLLNVKSDKRRVIEQSCTRELMYIHGSGGVLETGRRRERFILVPLACGKWQEGYLREALDNPCMLKTARLIKKNGEYYLSVNMQIEDEESITAQTYLGLARGLKNAVNYAIVGHQGEFVESGACLGRASVKTTNGEISQGVLHMIANSVVEAAVKNRAQVIAESLVTKGDRLKWEERSGMYSPVLNCRNYNALLKLLEYKLAGKGLPPPLKVSPVGIFYKCPECGLHSKHSRFSEDMFICTACGSAMDIEQLGSLNLARRLIEYRNTSIKVMARRTQSGFRFFNEDLGLEFHTQDPYNCVDLFKEEVDKIIRDFYENLRENMKKENYRKKQSLIKKLENEKDIVKIIQIV